MMSSMILFILWMCYCCRWKDNKFDTSTCDEQPQPFWIDVNSNTYYEALQWSLQQVMNTKSLLIHRKKLGIIFFGMVIQTDVNLFNQFRIIE